MSSAIYLRVSSDSQSTDSQEREIRAFISRSGYGEEYITVYRDVISGAKVKRPELDGLIADCRRGAVARVFCYKVDRLGRSVLHLSQIITELKGLAIPVFFTSQGMTTAENNPGSNLFLNMLAAFAEFERSMICDRVKSGIRARQEKGLKIGRPALDGETVSKIKAMRQEGKSMHFIAAALDVSPSTVHKTLNA